MRGGGLAGGTLEVLLEAQVEGLSDGADHVLGQAVGALQDVTRCPRGEETNEDHEASATVHRKTPA